MQWLFVFLFIPTVVFAQFRAPMPSPRPIGLPPSYSLMGPTPLFLAANIYNGPGLGNAAYMGAPAPLWNGGGYYPQFGMMPQPSPFFGGASQVTGWPPPSGGMNASFNFDLERIFSSLGIGSSTDCVACRERHNRPERLEPRRRYSRSYDDDDDEPDTRTEARVGGHYQAPPPSRSYPAPPPSSRDTSDDDRIAAVSEERTQVRSAPAQRMTVATKSSALGERQRERLSPGELRRVAARTRDEVNAQSAPIWNSFIRNFHQCEPGCNPVQYMAEGQRGHLSCHTGGKAIDVFGMVCDDGRRYMAIERGHTRYERLVNCMRGKMKVIYRNGRALTAGHNNHAHYSNGCYNGRMY